MKAFLKNYRQSPRKVRLLADLIRNKDVSKACALLDTVGKRAAVPVKKLLNSAVANAKHNNKTTAEQLFIKEIRVDEGPTLKRIRPRARRSAYLIRKRTSRIQITLEERKEKDMENTEKSKSKTIKPKGMEQKLKTKKQPLKIPNTLKAKS